MKTGTWDTKNFEILRRLATQCLYTFTSVLKEISNEVKYQLGILITARLFAFTSMISNHKTFQFLDRKNSHNQAIFNGSPLA